MSKFVERGQGKMSNLNKSTNNILVEKDFFSVAAGAVSNERKNTVRLKKIRLHYQVLGSISAALSILSEKRRLDA